jgi:hypothetical protein
MTDSELCSLDDGVDAQATASNFEDEPIAAVTPDQDACWFDKPHGSICRSAANAPLLVMIATTMAPRKMFNCAQLNYNINTINI